MKKIRGCAGAIGVWLWFLVLIYFGVWRWYEIIKWSRYHRKKWFFAKPSLVKLANRASGQRVGRGFIKVVGLLDGTPCPEALICEISEIRPQRPKKWPILQLTESGQLVYGYAAGMPFGEIRNLKETLLSLENTHNWGKETPWDRGTGPAQ